MAKRGRNANEISNEPATTTRKDRTEWFFERATFPLRDAPPERLEQFWKGSLRPAKSAKTGGPSGFGNAIWEPMGPFNIAGRTTSLVVQPGEKEDTLFAGTAGGGLWGRTSNEPTWRPIWPQEYSHNIGSMGILMAPGVPQAQLIVATGEANLSPDTYPGTGLYISIDSGESWKPFIRRGNRASSFSKMGLPRRVGAVAFDPHGVLLGALGSVTHDERMVAGLHLMKLAEGVVPCTFWGARSFNCHSILFHPQQKGRMYAAVDLRGSESGIWTSTDSGETWRHLTNGLPPGQNFGRISLAMAPSNPEILYALAADRRRQLLGVFRSRDGGRKWETIAQGDDQTFASERFLSYNNTIAVHPTRPDFVVWGGAQLYRQTGRNDPWKRITTIERFSDGLVSQKPNANYAHEDHHALLMPRGDVIYSGNDGGVAVSKDGGDTWADWSQGLMTTMFYDVDVAPSNGEVMGGGAQDNGTLITGVARRDGAKLEKGEFLQGFSGDGGWIVFDPEDEEKAFGSFQNFNVLRHQRPLPWNIWATASPTNEQLTEGERRQRAISVLEIEPGPVKGRHRRLWAGTHRLWWTQDDGRTWAPRTETFDGSAISTIHVAASNPQLIFVGTSKGGIFRSQDGGVNWTQDLGGPEIPRRLITRIETHPRNPKEVAVTVASTGFPGAQLLETVRIQKGFGESVNPKPFEKAYSNVFLSSDMGATWQDIDAGDLPNVVFNAVAYDTCRPGLIYAGGDAGVWVKFDDGWHPLIMNMPNVVVSDLVFHDKDRTLTAATYGRGIWRLRTAELSFDGHESECR